jgi:hypothetical protein
VPVTLPLVVVVQVVLFTKVQHWALEPLTRLLSVPVLLGKQRPQPLETLETQQQ